MFAFLNPSNSAYLAINKRHTLEHNELVLELSLLPALTSACRVNNINDYEATACVFFYSSDSMLTQTDAQKSVTTNAPLLISVPWFFCVNHRVMLRFQGDL
ncbi:hypothetical protein [Arsenophonus endosymbiont of Aleurodicus floccissimus]|uniref:hypothetical protein n=1 Tax=Arsenophonus endosymbiont of Aleurodicus floccissimus TaxID=2152761 RepID=UPI0011C489DB|nr:hypothetical protein [Arsenophonus endosymbiont of Aleurodicus floccissimus]